MSKLHVVPISNLLLLLVFLHFYVFLNINKVLKVDSCYEMHM